MKALTRSVPSADAALLHAIAQHGRAFVRLPDDCAWLRAAAGDDRVPFERRLAEMTRRGSLASVGRQRWVVLPAGASSLEAAPLKTLLAAKLDGRVDWYLGYLSALADHALTDIDPDDVYVGTRGLQLPTEQQLGTRRLIIVHHRREDDWRGVERQREGRVFTYRSDIERTLLDTLDQPRRCGPPEVWVRAWERAMRGHVRQARRVIRALGGPLTGRTMLDASRAFGDGSWRRDRETGVVVNLPDRAIDGWLEYGK